MVPVVLDEQNTVFEPDGATVDLFVDIIAREDLMVVKPATYTPCLELVM